MSDVRVHFLSQIRPVSIDKTRQTFLVSRCCLLIKNQFLNRIIIIIFKKKILVKLLAIIFQVRSTKLNEVGWPETAF